MDGSNSLIKRLDSMSSSQIIRGKFKEKLLNETLKFEDLCLRCLKIDSKIQSHPIFIGGICSGCKDSLKNAVTGNEIDPKFCIVCGTDKDSVYCLNELCLGVFCAICVNEFCPKETWPRILQSKNWLCFLCQNPEEKVHLIKRKDWESNILSFFNKKTEHISVTKMPKPVRVLSLFDGIGAGFVSLRRLGISIKEYFASEIDEAAIRISSVNSHGKIKQLGNVNSISKEVLKKIGPIDLLLGGSPCTELSLVNPSRTGLYDTNATGILFFEYVRILKELRDLNTEKTILFLFENTSAMPQVYRDAISRFLGCDPILLDAIYFCPMKRARFFWGNIPGMEDVPFEAKATNHCLGSFLTKNCKRLPFVKHIRTITTNSNSLQQGAFKTLPVLMNGEEDSLWITEIENIFGFKEHYTDIGDLPTTKRLSLVGSSWCIPVVCHLLRNLTNYFE